MSSPSELTDEQAAGVARFFKAWERPPLSGEDCPADHLLLALGHEADWTRWPAALAGLLNDKEAASVIYHVRSCARCSSLTGSIGPHARLPIDAILHEASRRAAVVESQPEPYWLAWPWTLWWKGSWLRALLRRFKK